MDEDFALWNFLEEERERYSKDSEDLSGARSGRGGEEDDDEDEDEDEVIEKIAEKLGQGLLRQGGNY